jgi:hypothetical protein
MPRLPGTQWQAIVFVGMRHAAHLVRDWILRCAQLSFIDEVLVFVGHNSTKATKAHCPRLGI